MSTHTWSWFLGAPHQTPLVHNQELAAIARPWPAVRPCVQIILFALRHWFPQPAVWNNRVWRVHSDGCWLEDSPNFKHVIHGRTCRIEPFASKPLFLASTVNAMHRNAHIWNASHPLLVTYYCWVTVHSPSMKAKKKVKTTWQTPAIAAVPYQNMRLSTMPLVMVKSSPMGRTFHFIKCRFI